jgi:hypothetical protein
VGVFMGYVSRHDHALLDFRLSLPQAAILILEIKTYQAWTQAAVRAWIRSRDP